MIQDNDQNFINRLNRHPKLRERMNVLLNVVENTAGDCTKADDAEHSVIEELRKMGNDALHCWAESAVEKTTETVQNQQPKPQSHGKKKVYWHTTFGEIAVIEPLFRSAGQQIRPFITSAEITPRCCSLPLQRAMTDFGADHAFGLVPKKLLEHYGIEMPVSTVRNITEYHARQMHAQRDMATLPVTPGCRQQVAEIDGCLLPIVTIDPEATDKRQQKKLHWQEARLALVHEQGSATPRFDATFGGVDEAGQSLLNCAVAAGFGTQTHLHGVGDGAFWIADQIEHKFGSQASYLVDFYHVCDYLAEASKTCAPNDSHDWMETQKSLLKNNDYAVVIENLTAHLETGEVENNKAPVRACHRYLSNRTHQLDYKGAIAKGLPIGSGEIESAHRYVIQKRLKLPGAWWKAANVEPMLTLRVVRANDEWNDYWGRSSEAA